MNRSYYDEFANVLVSAGQARPSCREVTYQGQQRRVVPSADPKADLNPPAVSTAKAADAAPSDRSGETAPRRSEQDSIADRVRSGSLLGVLAFFFVTGLGLAFTPCVLPMVPILSGIIIGAGGERPLSRGRAFSLSVAYVLGMAPRTPSPVRSLRLPASRRRRFSRSPG
jgi:thiol:disulfide interchange protein DsbD